MPKSLSLKLEGALTNFGRLPLLNVSTEVEAIEVLVMSAALTLRVVLVSAAFRARFLDGPGSAVEVEASGCRLCLLVVEVEGLGLGTGCLFSKERNASEPPVNNH